MSFLCSLALGASLPFALGLLPLNALSMAGGLAGLAIINAMIFAKLHSEVLLLRYIDRVERDKLATDAESSDKELQPIN